MQVKLKKSIFYTYKVNYLEYIISDRGIKMDSEKIYIIKEWPTLKNGFKVLFFLEFTNFYYKFIKEYLKVIISLINLTKKMLNGFGIIKQIRLFENLRNNLAKN